MSIFQRLIQNIIPSGEKGQGAGHQLQTVGRVVPDRRRCVQCGVCSFNCPIGIPVREYARQGIPVQMADCITCGQCIQVCPRGTLRWETLIHPGAGEATAH